MTERIGREFPFLQSCRAVLFALFVAFITPLFSLLAILVCWLPTAWRYHIIGQWNRCVIGAARFFCGISYRVEGMENIPATPCVICSKHQSAWETFAYYLIFPRSCFVAKKSLLLIPFFGWGFYIAMGPIAINRAKPMAAVRTVNTVGQRRLRKGWNVVIFPEGTRVPVGSTKPFLPSACMLATKAGVPVLPVAHNSGRYWPGDNWGFSRKPGVIRVSIGKPVATANRKVRELNTQVEAWINAETKDLGG